MLFNSDIETYMRVVEQREILLERRVLNGVPESTLWEQLSLAQKFSASSLTQFGYELAYIRCRKNGNVAIMLCNDSAATISAEGEIDSSPNIMVRSEKYN